MKNGDLVKLKSGILPFDGGFTELENKEAIITSMNHIVLVGVVFFEKGLEGCRYWNIDELELVEQQETKVKS